MEKEEVGGEMEWRRMMNGVVGVIVVT